MDQRNGIQMIWMDQRNENNLDDVGHVEAAKNLG